MVSQKWNGAEHDNITFRYSFISSTIGSIHALEILIWENVPIKTIICIYPASYNLAIYTILTSLALSRGVDKDKKTIVKFSIPLKPGG